MGRSDLNRRINGDGVVERTGSTELVFVLIGDVDRRPDAHNGRDSCSLMVSSSGSCDSKIPSRSFIVGDDELLGDHPSIHLGRMFCKKGILGVEVGTGPDALCHPLWGNNHPLISHFAYLHLHLFQYMDRHLLVAWIRLSNSSQLLEIFFLLLTCLSSISSDHLLVHNQMADVIQS
eukprot:TRINITY_DN10754_c0_g1_i2.p2 TRINITY_DN10754_c0_g1~~TRINITY_DN10754_c0_g1_i2.p2  ORF type:complete len:176 (+),score=27.50 TRINITY_DN10754_c0_g1_i2:545-1072(+)